MFLNCPLTVGTVLCTHESPSLHAISLIWKGTHLSLHMQLTASSPGQAPTQVPRAAPPTPLPECWSWAGLSLPLSPVTSQCLSVALPVL